MCCELISLPGILIFALLLPIRLLSGTEYRQYQPAVFDYSLDTTSETDAVNPFMETRLAMVFTNGSQKLRIPGFYAADGNAAQTGASAGDIWRVIFTPPEPGVWTYRVDFRKGRQLALNNDLYIGEPVEKYHGRTGKIEVKPPSEDAGFFARRGGLRYTGSHYLYTQNGEALLLFGANSPENFLACEDIDGTWSSDVNKQYVKSWAPHVRDWRKGDPSWGEGLGKGIIGALNYLASKRMNVVYALTLNLHGDASDVWPFISPERQDFLRYDVSKLAQWDIVFSHAEKLGIVMELVLQEQENQLLLDDGYTLSERKLYIRELIARFGYHNNLIWNIGEENGEHDHYWPQGQDDQQRYMMIRTIKDTDPYKRPVLMHTFAVQQEREPIARRLLRFSKFDGLSMQVYSDLDVHRDIIYWLRESEKFNRPWLVMMDELGPWHTGVKADAEDPSHGAVRKNVLWGALTAGATGVEWYFGWMTPPNDLNAEDWRSREKMWEQSAVARNFFEMIDFTRMHNADSLLSDDDNFCFCEIGKTYVVYLKDGGSARLDLNGQGGEFTVSWYNPREGGMLQAGSVGTVQGGTWVSLGDAPADRSKDWVVLLRARPSE